MENNQNNITKIEEIEIFEGFKIFDKQSGKKYFFSEKFPKMRCNSAESCRNAILGFLGKKPKKIRTPEQIEKSKKNKQKARNEKNQLQQMIIDMKEGY